MKRVERLRNELKEYYEFKSTQFNFVLILLNIVLAIFQLTKIII